MPTEEPRLVTPEGESALYRIRLAERPSGDMTIALANRNESVATVESVLGLDGHDTLTFTRSNWNREQEVLVRGWKTT